MMMSNGGMKYLLSGLLLLCAVSSFGQPYERMLRRNFWNDGMNVTGIRQDSLSLANAEVGGFYTAGGFRSLNDASSEWSVGASTRAMKHLEKYSLTGAFSFDDTESYDMCGSMFSSPWFYPVDVMEFTPGRKSSQTYFIDGGISADLSENWRIGARFKMTSRNVAKRKDLRYTSYSLNLGVLPSLMFHSGSFAAGLTLVYGRNTEMITAEQIGSTQNAPVAFFNEGLMFGTYQSWTGSGVHLDESGVSGLPLQKNTYGAALSVQYDNFFAEVSADYSSGKAGERQIVWHRFTGVGTSALLGVRFSESHSLRVRGGYSCETNKESVLEKVVENGITLNKEYGSNQVFERGKASVSAEYEYLGRSLEARAVVRGTRTEKMSSPYYPYVYVQGMNILEGRAEALYHIGTFDIGLRALYLQGEISDDYERTVAETQSPSPSRQEDYYNIMNEYDTVPRVSAGASLRWNFLKGLYAEVSGGALRAFGVNLIEGNFRWNCALKLGYNF